MISITSGLQAIYNSNMKEKTPVELERENRLLRQQIQELTNNWNELEKWLDKIVKITANIDEKMTCKNVLDKMEEIKEGNNVSDRN